MADCARCGSTVISVPVDVGNDHLTIVRCARCDSHRWERDGEVVDLDEVLDLTSSWASSGAARRPGARPTARPG
jgi:hypothetical protein